MGTFAGSLPVEELRQRHEAELQRFLTRMLHCEDAAADALQEVWTRLIRLRPAGAVDNPRAYLFRVAANVARDRMGEARRRSELIMLHAGEVSEAVCARPDPESSAISAERLQVLLAAIDVLPPRCQEVFQMSRFEGLANGEIARRLDITRNAVEKNIIRAMMHCRARLRDAGL